MDNQKLEKIRKKQRYNELLFQITQYNLRNRKPPDKLIREARNWGVSWIYLKQSWKLSNTLHFKILSRIADLTTNF